MSDHPPIVVDALRVHGHLHQHEYDQLITHWTKLDQRLQSFIERSITLDLHVHDRDTPSQHIVLDANIGGFPTFVAKAASTDLPHALNVVRDEMIRQLSDAKNKSEPRHNRRLRRTARRSASS